MRFCRFIIIGRGLVGRPRLQLKMMAESAKETLGESTSEEPTTQEVNERAIDVSHDGITYVQYTSEAQMPDIMRLMKADLSEPYSIYTYRYFIHNWPHLCILVNLLVNSFRSQSKNKGLKIMGSFKAIKTACRFTFLLQN